MRILAALPLLLHSAPKRRNFCPLGMMRNTLQVLNNTFLQNGQLNENLGTLSGVGRTPGKTTPMY